MRGNSHGSTESVDDVDQCPTDFWKFGDDSCNDPIRHIEIKETVNTTTGNVTKREWSSVTVTGTQNKKATFDALNFFIQIQGDDGNQFIGVGVGYANGLVGDELTDVKVFFTVFDNVFEFIDVNKDGLDLPDLQATADWLPLYDIRDFSQFDYTVDNVPNVVGGLLYTANIQTGDGKVGAVCRIGNTNWDYTVPNSGGRTITINPYEMKCDMIISNWVYRTHPSNPSRAPSLALQGYVISAEFSVSLDPNAQNDNAVQNGEVTFGEGVGFFRWAKTVQGVNQNSQTIDYPVLVTDIELPNTQNPDFPPGTVFKTTTWTISNGDDTVSSFVWDPVSGIDPVKATPYVSSAGSLEIFVTLIVLLLAVNLLA